MIPLIHFVRHSVQGAITEQADHAAIIVIVLARTVSVEEAQPHALVAVALFEVHDLAFVHHFVTAVAVVLDNEVLKGYVLAQDSDWFSAVNLGEMAKAYL